MRRWACISDPAACSPRSTCSAVAHRIGGAQALPGPCLGKSRRPQADAWPHAVPHWTTRQQQLCATKVARVPVGVLAEQHAGSHTARHAPSTAIAAAHSAATAVAAAATEASDSNLTAEHQHNSTAPGAPAVEAQQLGTAGISDVGAEPAAGQGDGSSNSSSIKTPQDGHLQARQRHWVPYTAPAFLEVYPKPPEVAYNVMSFLGKKDPLGGKYFVPPERYTTFLRQYANALAVGQPLYLAESYQQQPYRHFQELDFPWQLPRRWLRGQLYDIVALVKAEVAEFYSCGNSEALVSMRTWYKVHLNFPEVVTTERLALRCRDKVVQALARRWPPELLQQQGLQAELDWDSVVDRPHGSFRLLGSQKAWWMSKTDPKWVFLKSYMPVKWDGDKWSTLPITYDFVSRCSIRATDEQLASFSRSPLFISSIFQDMQDRKELLEAKRIRKRAKKERKRLMTQRLVELQLHVEEQEAGAGGERVRLEVLIRRQHVEGGGQESEQAKQVDAGVVLGRQDQQQAHEHGGAGQQQGQTAPQALSDATEQVHHDTYA